MFPENDGQHPSKLTLARYATGELQDGARAQVEAWLEHSPEGRAYLEELEAARHEVPPLDIASLRRRAGPVPDALPVVPEPANKPLRWAVIAPLLLAAALLLGVLPVIVGGPPDPSVPGVRIKGGAQLELTRLDGEAMHPLDGPVGEGDVVGFLATGAPGAAPVLLGIDALGTATLYYPVQGDAPFQATGSRGPLPLSVTLDGAPGPETFVLVYGLAPEQALEGLKGAWAVGASLGVEDWVQKHQGDLVAVEKR